jgi:hypothetical protein
MQAKPLEQSVSMSEEDEQIREALNAHWHASAFGDLNANHKFFVGTAMVGHVSGGPSGIR